MKRVGLNAAASGSASGLNNGNDRALKKEQAHQPLGDGWLEDDLLEESGRLELESEDVSFHSSDPLVESALLGDNFSAFEDWLSDLPTAVTSDRGAEAPPEKPGSEKAPDAFEFKVPLGFTTEPARFPEKASVAEKGRKQDSRVPKGAQELGKQLFERAGATKVSGKDEVPGKKSRPDCGSWAGLLDELGTSTAGVNLIGNFGDVRDIDKCVARFAKVKSRGVLVKSLLPKLTPSSAALLACIYIKSLSKISVQTVAVIVKAIGYFPESLHPDIGFWKPSLHQKLVSSATTRLIDGETANTLDEEAKRLETIPISLEKSVETESEAPKPEARTVTQVRTTDQRPTKATTCTLAELKLELQTKAPVLYRRIANSTLIDKARQNLTLQRANGDRDSYWRDKVKNAIQENGEKELSQGAKSLLACMLMMGTPYEKTLLAMAPVLPHLPDELGDEIKKWAPELLRNVEFAWRKNIGEELMGLLQRKGAAWEAALH